MEIDGPRSCVYCFKFMKNNSKAICMNLDMG